MTTPSDFHTGSQRGTAQGKMGGQQDEGVKNKAQRLASEAGEKAVDTIESNVDRGKNRLANTLHSVADSLRHASSHMREEDPDAPNQFFDRAAEQVDRLSNFVQGQDLSRTAHEVEGFARRQPALFLGGAFLLGLAGARFLKSSQRSDASYEHGYQQRGGYAQRGYPGTRGSTGRSGYGAGAFGGGSVADREFDGRSERDWGSGSPADVSLRGGGSGVSGGMGGTGGGGMGAGGAAGTGTSRSRGGLGESGAGIGGTGGSMGARGTERTGGIGSGGALGGSAGSTGTGSGLGASGSTGDDEIGGTGGSSGSRRKGGGSSGSGGSSGGQR